jgi:hypothetical protein
MRLLILLLVLLFPPAAKAHDQYTEWKTETGASCCNEQKTDANGHTTGDCRPVRAYQDEKGNWIAIENGVEYDIPPTKVLPIKSPDGRSHLCETMGYVFCFVPGEVRS